MVRLLCVADGNRDVYSLCCLCKNLIAIRPLNSDIKIKFYGKVTDLSVIKTLCQQEYECWVGYIDWKNTEILPSTGGTMLWFAFDWIVCGLCYGKMFYLNMDTLTWS